MQLDVKYIYFHEINWYIVTRVVKDHDSMETSWDLSAIIGDGKREERRGGRFLNEIYVTEMGISWVNQGRASYIDKEEERRRTRFRRDTASMCDLTSAASRRRRYRGVMEANITPNVDLFTRARPCYTPRCLNRRCFNRGHKTQNMHTWLCINCEIYINFRNRWNNRYTVSVKLTKYRKGTTKLKRYSVFSATGLKNAGNIVMMYTAHLQNKQGEKWEKNCALYTEE